MLRNKQSLIRLPFIALMMAGGLLLTATDTETITDKVKLRALLEEQRAMIAQNEDHPDYYLVKFNIAQCLFSLDSLNAASAAYLAIAQKLPKNYRSVCFNHLGIIEIKLNNQRLALEYFKSAIISDRQNDKAKFNYELLKKRIEKEKPPPPPPSNTPPPPSGGTGNARPIPTEHLGKNWTFEPMSREQALLILEQQKLREEQYLQQLKKSFVRDKRYSSEPQW